MLLHSESEKVSLLVSVGGGAVSAELVSLARDKKPNIIYSVCLPFKTDEAPEKNKLVGAMDSLLGQALTQVVKDGMSQPFWRGRKKHISSALVSLSSPWFSAKVKNIELRENKTFVVSQSFLNSILESERKIFTEELERPAADIAGAWPAAALDFVPLSVRPAGEKSVDVVALENIFTNFKINGYDVTETLGQKTKNFSATLYLSVAPKPIFEIIQNQLSKFFSLKAENISVGSFPFISFAVAQNLFPSLENFLLVDVAAEMTDLLLVRKRAVAEVAPFSSGRNFIVRQIAKKFAVSSEIAGSLLRLWSDKKSDEETSAQMREIISDAEKEWSIYFENAVAELANGAVLPPVVCLIAGDDVFDLYTEFLKTPKDDSTAEFRKNIQLFRLDSSAMSHLYNAEPKFKPNVFLSALTVFYQHIFFANRLR